MKVRCLFIPLALGLGAALALLGLLGERPSLATAAPTAGTRYVATTGDNTGNDCTSQSAPCRTVQHGVDVASPGDTIKVATGVYSGVNHSGGLAQVVYISKTVTVRGGYTTSDWTVWDPEANLTILDAQRQGRIVYITGNIAPTIEGLCITGGDASDGDGSGGGIYVREAGAIIRSNVISGNVGNRIVADPTIGQGGGIYVADSASPVRVYDNIIQANIAISVELSSSTVTMEGVGGGIRIDTGSSAIITNNQILSNVVVRTNIPWVGFGGGAGIGSTGDNTVIDGNTIQGNVCNELGTRGGGGGIGLWGKESTVTNNWIAQNTAAISGTSGLGGGIRVRGAHTLTLTDNWVISNTAIITVSGDDLHVEGGGIWVWGGTVEKDTLIVQDNHFIGNVAAQAVASPAAQLTTSGGGLWVGEFSTVSIIDNEVRENIAAQGFSLDGVNSGMALEQCSEITLTGNTVIGNSATSGCGLGLLYSDATLVNNVVADNHTNSGASGLCIEGSSSQMLHTTIAHNTGGDGSGVWVANGSTVAMTNTILVSHTVGIAVAAGNTATLDATLWGNGVWANGEDWGGVGTIITGSPNYWGDPAFVNPDAGDYHIGPGSAAIDAGVHADLDTDIDGDPRPIGAAPDLGADEAWQHVFLPLILRAYTPLPADVHGPGFAEYTEITVTLPEAYEGYTLPVDVKALGNYDRFPFREPQVTLLAQNGFVASPSDWLEFFPLYQDANEEEFPVFITTDSVYHVYHLLFNKMLRDLEREHFEPDIRALTAACLRSAQTLYDDLLGTELEAPARGVLAYFAVANALIDPGADAPPDVRDLVDAELALIEAHAGFDPSPIFSRNCPAGCDPCAVNPPPRCEDQPCLCEDYSQYVPRGHYTRSEQLQRYFRTMIWYGRINMRLKIDQETRTALLITTVLRNTDVDGDPAADVWARVYDPTVFIVGKADDLGFHEYGALWDHIFGPDAPSTAISDAGRFTAFVEAARQLPPPQINSMWVHIREDVEEATQGFRFMGQRFVLDAYIFDELTHREVWGRWLPKALDVMTALGSEEAYAILDGLEETDYANYPEQMAKLRGEISALQLDSWTQSLYWNWLYALDPLLEAKEAQYPSFMRTQAWTRKDLHAALGSWTELKHDTILYAKQAMPPPDSVPPPPPPPPHGWVEPHPRAYARLLALTRMTHAGLESRGLLGEQTADNLRKLDELLSFLLDVSQRELAGERLTEDDYARTRDYGDELEELTLAAADLEESEEEPQFDEDEQAALVADVATSPDGRVLEEAIGRIFEIYAVVPDGAGGLHIAKGGVFSYYEFPWPMSDRLTDEAWRAMLEAGQAPERPEWIASFVAAGPGCTYRGAVPPSATTVSPATPPARAAGCTPTTAKLLSPAASSVGTPPYKSVARCTSVLATLY